MTSARVPSPKYQRTSPRLRGVGFCVFLCVGCASEPTSGPAATVRDSLGITIVENHEPLVAGGGGWALAPEPTVTIGSVDGPEEVQLYRVHGARRLPDGRIAVGNHGSREIKIFGADGTFIRSLGGDGAGPGEFSAVLLAGRLGDSLVVFDRRLQRVSLIHPDAGFVRSFLLADGMANYPLEGWFFGSGSVLIRDLPLDDSDVFGDGLQRASIPFRSCDMTGALRTDFGGLPGAEQITVTRQSGGDLITVVTAVPFGKSPQIAVAGDQLFVGTQDAFEIRVLGSDGTLQKLVRLDRAPLPVTNADLEAYIREQVAGMEANEARTRRQELEEMPLPQFQPAHGAITADAAGYLFVEDFRRPETTTGTVNVFDPDGTLVGRFESPEGTRILEIGADYLLGLYQDDMEVEYLRLYRLTRP